MSLVSLQTAPINYNYKACRCESRHRVARTSNRPEFTYPLKLTPMCVATLIFVCFVYDATERRTKYPGDKNSRSRRNAVAAAAIAPHVNESLSYRETRARPFVAKGTDALSEENFRGGNDAESYVLLSSRKEEKRKERRR